MVGGISFGGLGSGLDTGAIIDALLKLERVPINNLESTKKAENQKLSLMGTFEGHVKSLRAKAKELSTLAGFLSFQVQPSEEGVATFSASPGAVAGSHTLRVDQLASSDRWAFDAVADHTAPLASADGQSVSFTYDGTTYDVSVTQAQSSLVEIADAIEAAVGGAVNVSVVNTGPASSPSYQLVLASAETGEDFRISGLSSTIAGLTVDGTGPDPSGAAQSANNITVGSNAVAAVDGLLVTRSDNDFSDVLDGIGITLTKADAGNTISFTVDPDKEAVKERVQGFVDAYNKVIEFINKQSQYSEDDGPGGPLFGDSALRTIRRTIDNVLFGQDLTSVQNDPAGYGTLRLLGIEGQPDGTLIIDPVTFETKLDNDLDAFADLFVDSDGFDNGGAAVGTPGYYQDLTADTGLADDLMREIDRILDPYVDQAGNSYDGLFTARETSINKRIKDIDKQIEDREYRLERYEQQLVARFTALEVLMAELNSQLAYFQQGNAS